METWTFLRIKWSGLHKIRKGFFFIYFITFGCTGSHCAQVFSRCDKSGPLSSRGVQASHCSGSSCCRAQAIGAWVSRCSLWAPSLCFMGLFAPQHMEYSWTRDRTCVPFIDRQIVTHCTTMEVQKVFLRGSGMSNISDTSSFNESLPLGIIDLPHLLESHLNYQAIDCWEI